MLALKPPQCHRAAPTTFGYVARDAAAADGTPGGIRALLLITCGAVEEREGSFPMARPELLVYGDDGLLEVLASRINVAALEWKRDDPGARLPRARDQASSNQEPLRARGRHGRRREVTALPLLALLALDWFPRGLAPVDAGGGPTSAKACVGCHADAHAEWARSRHGLAWTNAIFQREYKDKPLDWCVHCHAPLKEQLTQVHAGGGPLAKEGVTCAVCHVRGTRMLARERHEGSPHDTDARADFGGPAYCGGCHQFNFPVVENDASGHPALVRRYTEHPMQDTEHQHATGAKAAQECQTCHARASTSGHLFPGGHDAAFVARAITVASCRDREVLDIALTNTGAGHNVPTGDLHRHLVLRAWRASAPEHLGEALFGRRFEQGEDGGKRAVEDTTIPVGATRHVRFRVAALGGARVPNRVAIRIFYTIDEFPFRGRELDAPTFVTMFEDERPWSATPRCARAGR